MNTKFCTKIIRSKRLQEFKVRFLVSQQEINKSQREQKLFKISISNEIRNKIPKTLSNYEFNYYSEAGEDGIVLYLLEVIGTTNKIILDIGGSDGIFGNSGNLILHNNFNGIIIDSSKKEIDKGRTFYNSFNIPSIIKPLFINSIVTLENINEIISSLSVPSSIDILSLDIDGVDFWILKEISLLKPRIIIIEFNNIFNGEESFTVPYSNNFKRKIIGDSHYCGASLAAFNKLLQDRDYSLVGINSASFNAFFVHNSCMKLPLRRNDVVDLFYNSPVWMHKYTKNKSNPVRDLKWIKI